MIFLFGAGYTIHQVVHFTSAVLHPHMEHLSPFETEEVSKLSLSSNVTNAALQVPVH